MSKTSRPVWATIVSSLLALLALAGFAYAAWSLAFDVSPAAKAAWGGFGLWFGASALLSAIGLWSLRRWALAPLSSWVLACLAAPWVPYLVAVEADSPIEGIGSSVIMALVTAPIWLAARRMLRHPAPPPPGAA